MIRWEHMVGFIAKAQTTSVRGQQRSFFHNQHNEKPNKRRRQEVQLYITEAIKDHNSSVKEVN